LSIFEDSFITPVTVTAVTKTNKAIRIYRYVLQKHKGAMSKRAVSPIAYNPF
jgi:hypothetical protein